MSRHATSYGPIRADMVGSLLRPASVLTEDAQWAKLRTIVEIADEVALTPATDCVDGQ
jgi:hypothetical protein